MRVSTSKLTYVVFHMSLLQVAWGLTLVAQVCQKTFDYIIRVHIHVLLHAFATKLLQGHPIRGPKFGARLLWHRYAKKHLITSPSFTYMCFYVPLLQSSLGALFGARSSGPDSCGTKKHLITSSEFTYMCFYMPLLQSCLGGTPFGARSSGLDSCGIGMPKSIRLHHHRSHTCASTCLCYKVAWGHSVRGPKFGARLFWHRYAKKHLITSSEFTYMCFYVHAFATKLPGGTPFGA